MLIRRIPKKLYISLLVCIGLIVSAMILLYGSISLEMPTLLLLSVPFIFSALLLFLASFCTIKLCTEKLE